MTRVILPILLTIIIQSMSFGFTRKLYMDRELKNASLVKEIIVIGYNSRIDTLPYQEPIGIEKVIDKMIYSYIDKPDSILEYFPPFTGSVNFTPYYDIATKDTSFHPNVPEGYWPAIGDTVLVVFNSEKNITLFAEIVDSTEAFYRFWSPFHTSSWSTIFLINSPFKPDKSVTKMYDDVDYLQIIAKRYGYELATKYHCIINKDEFWRYLENIRKE